MTTTTFELKGPPREIHDDAVQALDAALEKRGTGPLLHALDPKRLLTFENGGPAVWSVALVPIGHHELHVTYGLSFLIDPARTGTGYELSLRVPTYPGGGLGWAPFFLRMLGRYVVTSKRELKLGEYFPFFKPISRVAFAPADRMSVPHTEMDSVAFTTDPDLPFVDTPRGRLELRRVVGLFPDERERMEPWSAQGVIDLFSARNKELCTDIGRGSYLKDPAFVAACEAGSARDGSRYGYVAVEGIGWEQQGKEYVVRFPGGHDAKRILRMVSARLGHGQHLLIHDVDPDQQHAVVLTPGKALKVQAKGNELVIQLPLDFPLFSQLGDEPFEATFDTGAE
jgi:hypothetical protein